MIAALGAIALLGATVPDFVRDVQSILAGSFVRCHGPNVRKGLLRLHTQRELREGGESGDAVVPGDPEGSLLYQKLNSRNPRARMPQEAEPLTAEQVETIRRWIEAAPRGRRASRWPRPRRRAPRWRSRARPRGRATRIA